MGIGRVGGTFDFDSKDVGSNSTCKQFDTSLFYVVSKCVEKKYKTKIK